LTDCRIFGLPDFRIVELKSSLEQRSFGFKFDNSSIRQSGNSKIIGFA